MSGVVLISALVAWWLLSAWVSAAVARSLETRNRSWLGVLLFIPLSFVPLADEAVGAMQLRKLCQENWRKEDQFAAARGSLLKAEIAHESDVRGTLLRVRSLKHVYANRESGKPEISFISYTSGGGWLSRALNISETEGPLTFSSGCGGREESIQTWLDRYQIKLEFTGQRR